VARREYLAAAGVDPEAIAKAWAAGEAVPIAIARDEVPLPLGIAVWRRAVFGDGMAEDELAPAILLQRRAACFYHALASLDEPTLAYLDAHPDFLAGLFQRRAEAMTTFGRSLHIANGRVVVPGGEPAVPVWEQIVEHKVTEPEAFVDALFTRDAGRFAFFYDTITHVPEPVRQLVLRGENGNVDEAVVRIKRLARVFADVAPPWRVVESPMWRPPVDPAMWLNELRVAPGAQPAQLAAAFNKHVWEEIFRSDDVTGGDKAAERAAEREADARKDAEKAERKGQKKAEKKPQTEAKPGETRDAPDERKYGPVDIAWLAERVFLDDAAQQRDRYEMTLWAQRALANVAADSPDVASVIATCRGYARYGLLLLTLERLDIHDPALYRAALLRAAAIAANGGGDRERTSLALYQSSLALIERLRLSRRIDAATTKALLTTLVQIPVDEQEPVAIATWIEHQLASALGGEEGVEARLLQALGGPPTPRHAEGSAASVQWEGQPYRVDVAAAERGRIAAVHAVQERAKGFVSLDAALRAFRTQPSGGKAGKKTEKAEKKNLRQAGATLAEALVAIVYAAQMPGDHAEMLQNVPWQRHDFGLDARPEQLRRRLAWLLAEERTGGGVAWHLRGSLLAMDLAVARYHLRRINDDPPTPTINEGDRNAATIGVVLLNPFETTDADRDRLEATLTRGRAAIADRAQDAEALLTLARRAGFSEWRLQALRWLLAQAAPSPNATPDPASSFALIDQFWAGDPDADTIARLDRWGPSIVPLTGQLATRLPRPRAWEDFAGRLGTGVFATQAADVHVRTASFLASQKLPAALYRGAMAAAVQELIDRVPVRQFDDWSAVVMYVRTLAPGRYEDYIAALAVDGPLRTVGDDGEDGHE
jgi:hypothetical protein